MKKFFMALLMLVSAMTVSAQGFKVYKDGQVTATFRTADVDSIVFLEDVPEPVDSPTIYLAGYEINDNFNYVATVWKNGVPQQLSDGTTRVIASDVFVDDDDNVYVCGREDDSHWVSSVVYWKNGERVNITDGKENSLPLAIYVRNGDVYIAGYRTDSVKNENVAVLWKNGVAQDLSDTTSQSLANDVYVTEDGDVYVVGYTTFNKEWKATVWHNGTATYYGGNNGSNMRALCYKDGDLYASGEDTKTTSNDRVVYWKNGVENVLSVTDGLPGHGQGIAVGDDGKVYVVGDQRDANTRSNAPKLWIDGVDTDIEIPSGYSNITLWDVASYGNDYYAVGTMEDSEYNSVVGLWHNGAYQRVTPAEGYNTVSKIFIK